MKRIILDTNILVAALRSRRGSSRELIRHLANDAFVALVSVPLFLEYETVLKSPAHLLRTDLLKPERIDTFLGDFLKHAEPVSVSYLWRPQLNNPADEMVLEAAVNGRADWLVTRNVRHFAVSARKFGIGVAGPGPFLQKMNEELHNASK